MRILLVLVAGAAGTLWLLSISARRTAGRMSRRRETIEASLLVVALFVLYAVTH